MDSLLEVLCGHADDARRAEEGGADRIHLVADPKEGALSPAPDLVAAVCAATRLPVRVTLRLREGWSTDGGEVTRLRGLAAAYVDAGAEGMVMGFLDPWSAVDVDVCATVAGAAGWPWTFDRAVDYCLDFDHAWIALRTLPGLDGVLSAGSARDVEHGLDGLVARARGDRWAAENLVVAGGLQPEHVPWLHRAGIRGYHLDLQARPLGQYKAWVDADLVRSWRTLLDRSDRQAAQRLREGGAPAR
ncbi:copper homeostasis protein [Raineyella antarctica]|uniref:Copper homeostasis protein cutC homolog n=1 Tax=Raineyella antarctica TaxID=1577474 RepID=A0A1G6GE72_9ACTN|nr:copper homeostasis protein CutC [Raineyella antarctica]SDB80312.1 copper homeostasis protein [Raineyella antarctica]